MWTFLHAKKPLSLVKFNLILAGWLGLVFNYSFYHKIYLLSPYSPVQALGLVVASLFIVIASYNLVLQLISWRFTSKLIAILLLIIGGLSAYFVNSLGVLITADQIQNMLQTDWREATDLWSMPLLVWCFLSIAVPIWMLVKFQIQPQRLIDQLRHKTYASLASIVLILGLLFVFYVDYAAIFREHRDLKTMLSPQNTFAAGLKYYQHKTPKADLPLLPYGTDAQMAAKSQITPKLMVLVVLHQMGSHGPAYYKRSRPPYQPFAPMCNSNAIQGCSLAALKNAYDNSIVYTDHVLAQVIKTLANNNRYQSAFWYLSDHGESTGEHGLYLHGAPYAIAPSQQTHVPMLMWFSSSWQAHQPAQVACLQQQQSHVFSQDVLFPSLLSLLDIKSQVIDAKNDMLNSCPTAPSKV